MAHHHNHGHNCEAETANSDHDNMEMGIEYSLYQKIDLENLECLNESETNAGRKVFKPFEKRLDFEDYVESDADAELIFNIPFTGNVKLKGIILIGANDDSHPKKMRLFKNRERMSFDDVSVPADQEFELQRGDATGTMEYATKVVSFSSVHHLTLHFPINFGEDNTRIYYIGLRGEYFARHSHGVTICTYETRPNVADHKANLFDAVNQHIQ